MRKTSPAAAAASTLTGKEREGLLARRAERSAIGRKLDGLDRYEADLVAAAATRFCRCGCGTPLMAAANLPQVVPARAREERARLQARLVELDGEERQAVRWAVEMRRRWETLRPGLVAAAASKRHAVAAQLVSVATFVEPTRKPGALYLESDALGPHQPPHVFRRRERIPVTDRRTQ